MKKRQGFTLIELMIVVAIIAIIAAIAIPNLLRSRMNANETAAIKSLKTVLDGQGNYYARNNVMAIDFDQLQTATDGGPGYLEGNWGGTRSGYDFTLTSIDLYSFTCDAVPASPQSGTRAFHLDAGGGIHHVNGAGPATAADPLISDAPVAP